MVSFDPKLMNNVKVTGANPFAAGKVAFAGGGESEPTSYGVEQYGTGKGINGTTSSGVLGEVTGTGINGEHKLNTYF